MGGMSDDDQMMMDLGVRVEADEKRVRQQRAWAEWVAPQRIESQIAKFLTETLPIDQQEISAHPWWEPPLLYRICDQAYEVFPDTDTLISSEKHNAADQLVCFLGELFVRRAGAGWVNIPDNGPILYDQIGPSLHFGFTADLLNVVHLAVAVADHGLFNVVTGELSDYAQEWADAGKPPAPLTSTQ
ncbi:hypothetical protein CRH09_25660 [Nocardia terpenica]|uniref:Uncharacterized protein n=2 Tax=Nocardia terpenica TaxID=455432 RepID=A0A291RP49_9NOCA|nr:hypothetical protein CRH09_25660 [Nocardia terpenica]